MKKLLVALAIAILSVFMLGVCGASKEALAYSTPNQTGNVTDVIIWQGEEFTIAGFENSMTAASEAGAQVIADEMSGMLADIIGLALVIFLAVLAFWHRDPITFVLAGIVCMMYGFDYWSTSHTMSIAVVIVGAFMWFKAGARGKA